MTISNALTDMISNSDIRISMKGARFYKWRYGNVYYSKTGHGSPILLVHDLVPILSADEWMHVIPELAKDHTVYAIDLLGCGRSDKPKMIYTQFLYVQLLNHFIEEVIGEPVDIVATGNAFAAAVMAERMQPDQFKTMCGINPIHPDATARQPGRHRELFRDVLSSPVVGTYIYNICNCHRVVRDKFLKDYFHDTSKVSKEMVDIFYQNAHYDHQQAKHMFSSLNNNYLNLDIRPALKQCEKPIHIIYGSDNPEKRLGNHAYRRYCQNVHVYQIAQTAGLPQLEKPVETAKIIEHAVR